jgi:hypothetical protein
LSLKTQVITIVAYEYAAEKLDILSASGKSVIPEVAERLSGIQEKQYFIWIPDLDFVSSGMTFGAVSRLFQQPARQVM